MKTSQLLLNWLNINKDYQESLTMLLLRCYIERRYKMHQEHSNGVYHPSPNPLHLVLDFVVSFSKVISLYLCAHKTLEHVHGVQTLNSSKTNSRTYQIHHNFHHQIILIHRTIIEYILPYSLEIITHGV